METITKYEAIQRLFHPKSIAIIGASNDPNKISGRPLDILKKYGYKGSIYPINPNYNEIQGMKAYGSILDIEDQIDVAIIALSSKMIIQSLEDCGKQGVKTAVIFAGGFAESGKEGELLQNEMIETAKRHGIRLFGPNCTGLANMTDGIPLTFGVTFTNGPTLLTGEIGFVSQSGGIGWNVLNRAQKDKVGFNYWVTTGNEADLGFLDFVSYLLEQPDVKAAGGYIESIKDADALRRAAQRSRELNKPFICLKVGTSNAGMKAITSHTGSLAGADVVYDAAFRQYGVIRVKNSVEMLDTFQLATYKNRPKGKRLGLVTLSGGNGIMMTDYAVECGLEIPTTSAQIQQELMKTIPPFGSPKNPVDVTAQVVNDPNLFNRVIGVITQESQFDAIVLDVVNQLPYLDLEAMKQVLEQTDKLVCLVAFDISLEDQEKLRALNIPYFDDFYRCIKAIGNLAKYHEYVEQFKSSDAEEELLLSNPDQVYLPNDGGSLGEYELKSLLKSIVSVPRGGAANTVSEAVSLARDIGYPVVMKVNAAEIAHKTDVGGVKINLRNDSEVENAFNDILKNVQANASGAKINGVLIEQFIEEKGIEVVIGFNKDPIFGHSLTFGLGGVFVEVLRDVSTRVLPIRRNEVKKMIREIKGWPLLEGFREKVNYDIEALENVILALAKFVELNADRIAEFEINPLKVLPKGKGVYVLDSLLKLQPSSSLS